MKTPQQQAEDELQRERNLLRTLIDQLPVCTYVKDREGRFLAANLATARAMGAQSPDELLGKTDADFYPQHLTSEYGEDERRIFATGEPLVDKNEPHVDPSGAPRAVLTTKVPFRDGSGEIVGLVGVSQDVTERKLAEEALQQAKADAENANRAKSRLLAYVSHDLRTPMNSILGMVDLALARITDPTARDFLQTAKESADLLLALLNDLLDSARIESGRLELEAVPFSLRRALDQTRRVLTLRANEKGIAFSCCIPPDVPDAFVGDQVRLRQILFNLAGNGIKFTERGEVAIRVRVAVQSADEVCLEFAVRDTGIGIPQDHLKCIFQPFTQADSSGSRRFEGTGLGLTICARLVAMMRGHIRVESAPGQGSTFYFTVRLPLAQELPTWAETVPEGLTPLATPLCILLVEDNPANRKLVQYILEERGHTVEIATDGQQALKMTQESAYDVVLMDVQMPGMDGMETTAAIRKWEAEKRLRGSGEGLGENQQHAHAIAAVPRPPTPKPYPQTPTRVPIVAMTAYAMNSDRQRCLEAGMDGYLSKPINEGEMISLVENLAAGSAAPATAAVAVPSVTGPNNAGAVPDLAVPPGPVYAAGLSQTDTGVFDPQEAIKRCLGRREALRSMVKWFFAETERLLPEMHRGLQRGDVVELGRLAHRLKGTVVYLGARRAVDAAQRAERFVAGGSLGDADEAVHALERECEALKTALIDYQLEHPTGPQRKDQEENER